MIKTINDRWKGYESMFLDSTIGEIQRRNIKRAFFAGFEEAITPALYDISTLPAKEGFAQLESFQRQAKGFFGTVAEGKA